MHNGRLANPGDRYTLMLSGVTSKRNKTPADYEEMARIEFIGGLYMGDDGPVIPGHVVEAALIGRGGAARSEKKGKQAAAGLFVPDDYPLIYDGPRDVKGLWEDERFRFEAMVRVGQARIARTRPIFKNWAAEVDVIFNPELVSPAEVDRWMNIAGATVGLMDWRPRYGRFEVEKI